MMLLGNLFVLSSPVCLNLLKWTFYINKRFQKWVSRSRCQVPEQKHLELNLEINCSEYIPVFPLIFQISLNVSENHRGANKLASATCKESIRT